MSSSAVVELGTQRPRVLHRPDQRLSSRGHEAIEVAERAGLELDPWQRQVLVDGCRMRGRRFASFEVGVNCTRQNGKGGILEARELAGLFAWGEPFVDHSSHRFDTSLEAFRRLLRLIEGVPEFDSQVQRVVRSHGEEGIELKSGQRIRYRTRSKGGGRGFTGGLLVFDEAMILALAAHTALVPTLSTQEFAQIWYAGSAVDEEIHEHGLVWTRIRNRGIEGRSKRLAYFEWSLPYEHPDEVPDEVLEDREAWAQANPAYGVRISEAAVEAELEALDRRGFATERLGVGAWPDVDAATESAIDLEAWGSLEDRESTLLDPVVFAFDVSPDRQAAIAAAGRNGEGLLHAELVEARPGTKWVPGRLVELTDAHDVEAVIVDGYGPAASLIELVRDAGVTVDVFDSTDVAEACVGLADLVTEAAFRHRGEYELEHALRGARSKMLGDRWAWSRKASTANVSSLVAVTLALSRARRIPADVGEVNIW